MRLPHPSLCAWPWLVRAPRPPGSFFLYCGSRCLCAAAQDACSAPCWILSENTQVLSFIFTVCCGELIIFIPNGWGKVGCQSSQHCQDGDGLSLGVWMRMLAKLSSSTWPQMPVTLERGGSGVHRERWREMVGWLQGRVHVQWWGLPVPAPL